MPSDDAGSLTALVVELARATWSDEHRVVELQLSHQSYLRHVAG